MMEDHALVLKRLRWRCRRGMLEMDIILSRFIEQGYNLLSRDEQKAFDELLDLPDTVLWDKVSGQQAGDSASQDALLLKLRAA